MPSHHPSPRRRHGDPLPLSPMRLPQAVVLSVSATLSHWARKATQAVSISNSGGSPGSPSKKGTRPTKRLLSNISSKAMSLVLHGRKGQGKGEEGDHEQEEYEFNFGKGGVWQRTILMGDKCQPLNFSGVIYYDEKGKQLDHVPIRSPARAPYRVTWPGAMTARSVHEPEGHTLR